MCNRLHKQVSHFKSFYCVWRLMSRKSRQHDRLAQKPLKHDSNFPLIRGISSSQVKLFVGRLETRTDQGLFKNHTGIGFISM